MIGWIVFMKVIKNGFIVNFFVLKYFFFLEMLGSVSFLKCIWFCVWLYIGKIGVGFSVG